jgi:multidrug efflux pump subunit AcrB
MINFFLSRPISVIMTFVAILLLGMVASGLLPVSMLPAIDVPEITVQVVRPGESVRQIEQGIVEPMRYQLLQVPNLETLTSECRDGKATIRLRFGFKTDVNYAFIDVNERIDAAMRMLPSDMQRPAIVKASAADLPVFYINISSKEGEAKFQELCDLTRAVLVKRLEQLPQVAMVDVTGQVEPELHIEPNEPLLLSLGVTHEQISRVLEENNVTMGSLEVVDGQYRYNIRISNNLNTVNDVRNIRLNVNGRLMALGELANINIRPQPRSGLFMANGQPALSLAVVKQSDARMDDIREKVNELIGRFKWEYPSLEVQLTRDQTELLDYSISNLKRDLLYGGILAFLVLFFFLKDARTPWLIGISVPTSLVVSFLFFYLFGVSINIVSLSGLILGVGMMIDNSIIVIDNIVQYMNRGESLTRACVKGTNEVIGPLVSSLLSTCAVFVPLVFLSGISGALFFDQAISVAIGLVASLIVSVALIPVLFHLWFGRANKKGSEGRLSGVLRRLDLFKLEAGYEKAFHFTFTHRRTVMVLFVMLLVPAVYWAIALPKQRFPDFERSEAILHIDWNDKISLDENQRRVNALYAAFKNELDDFNGYIGGQQYLFHKDLDLSISEASVYIRCGSSSAGAKITTEDTPLFGIAVFKSHCHI